MAKKPQIEKQTDELPVVEPIDPDADLEGVLLSLDEGEPRNPDRSVFISRDGSLIGNMQAKRCYLEHPGESLKYTREQQRALVFFLAMRCDDARRDAKQDPKSPLRGLNAFPSLLQRAYDVRNYEATHGQRKGRF